MSYLIGVDVGETFTTAAVGRGGRAEVVLSVPSVVSAGAARDVVVGDAGPWVTRRFLGRVGDPTPVLVGAQPVAAESLVARVVAHVVAAVAARMGGPAARVAVTYPVGWGPHRLAALRSALPAGTLTLPAAAAVAVTSGASSVAVHDLGGSRFTAAVLRRGPDGRFTLAGRAEELPVGGADLDDLVFEHVRSALGGDQAESDLAAMARLRRACTAAKETLSSDTEVRIPVVLPGIDTQVRLTRAELEELARPLVAETAAALTAAIGSAGVVPTAVVLAGGSARLPLLTQVVSEQLGRPVTVVPAGAAAIGAALVADEPPPEPTRVALRVVDAPTQARPVEPVRPPVPVGSAPTPAATSRGMSRKLMAAAAAAVAAMAVAGGVALASRDVPPGADADPAPTSITTTTTTQQVTTTTVVPTTTEAPTRQPTRTRRSTPRTTTTTAQPTTTTTTSATPSAPDSSTVPESTQGGRP